MPRKDRSPSSWQNTPLVLLAVVSLLAAGVALALLFASQPPGNDSAEAGFARDMIVHHAQAVQMAEIIRDKTKSDSMRLMIAHHEAAIPMAKAILKRTDEPEVSQLATSIIESQRAEIENMKAMVDKMVGDSAEVDLEPAQGSGTAGTATLSKAKGGGVKVVVKVSG